MKRVDVLKDINARTSYFYTYSLFMRVNFEFSLSGAHI